MWDGVCEASDILLDKVETYGGGQDGKMWWIGNSTTKTLPKDFPKSSVPVPVLLNLYIENIF